MGSLPPVLSMRMSAQSMPVSMRTEATRLRWMLISLTVNQDRFRRITACSVTSRVVRHRRLPFVQREAWKISLMGTIIGGSCR